MQGVKERFDICFGRVGDATVTLRYAGTPSIHSCDWKWCPDSAELGAFKHATKLMANSQVIKAAKHAIIRFCARTQEVSCLLSDHQVHDCTIEKII